jgi:hypothetical protein
MFPSLFFKKIPPLTGIIRRRFDRMIQTERMTLLTTNVNKKPLFLRTMQMALSIVETGILFRLRVYPGFFETCFDHPASPLQEGMFIEN